MPKNTQIIFFILLLSANFSFSKGISVKETLNYLNEKLEGNYTFSMKGDNLTLECFSNGEKVRRDNVYLTDIDPFSIKYNEEENAVVLSCTKKSGDCIDRKIYVNKSRNQYRRMIILMEGVDEKSMNGIVNALVHLTRIVQDPQYESSVPFEE